MPRIQIHIGDSLEDMGRRFVDAWHRAERGEPVNERHLSFDSVETALARGVTVDMLRGDAPLPPRLRHP